MDELEKEVKRLLASETFEPNELVDVLAKRGHEASDIEAAIAVATTEIQADQQSPAQLRRETFRRRSARFMQIGVLVLGVGLAFNLFSGGGWLTMLLVIVVGGAFLGAGYRAARHAKS